MFATLAQGWSFPNTPARLNQALIAGGAAGSYLWNSVSPDFDMTAAFCPQKDSPAQGFAADRTISFKSLKIDGELGYFACSWKTTQIWRNDSPVPIEAIYTFPLRGDAVLRGLSAKIGARRVAGRVVPAREAEEAYENAIGSGDLAILVQKSSLGLYTVNLGSLAPGESVEIELDCSRLNRWDEGRSRFVLPLTVSPRFGDASRALKTRAKIFSAPDADYRVAIRLRVSPELKDARISSPETEIKLKDIDGAREIVAAAKMDGDFALDIDVGASPPPPLSVDAGDDRFLFIPPVASSAPGRRLSARILADCSGSMSGPRVALARKFLLAFASLLSPVDSFQYARFGSSVAAFGDGLRKCSALNRLRLRKAIKSTYAEMGATRLEEAIIRAVAEPEPAPVILVTDGNVWSADNAIREAATRGRKIFCVAVGSAPNLPLLEKIAEETGGECFSLNYGEDPARTARAVYRAARDAPRPVQIDWGVPVVWQSPSINGSPAIALARTSPAKPPVVSGSGFRLALGAWRDAKDENLAATAAARQLKDVADAGERERVAMRYGLLTDETALILEYRRKTKTAGLPRVEYVPQMIGRDAGERVWDSHAFFSVHAAFGLLPPQSAILNFLIVDDKKATLAKFFKLWRESVYSGGNFNVAAPGLENARALLASIADRHKLELSAVGDALAAWIVARRLLPDAPPLARHEKRRLKAAPTNAALTAEFDAWLNA